MEEKILGEVQGEIREIEGQVKGAQEEVHMVAVQAMEIPEEEVEVPTEVDQIQEVHTIKDRVDQVQVETPRVEIGPVEKEVTEEILEEVHMGEDPTLENSQIKKDMILEIQGVGEDRVYKVNY